MNSRRLKKAVFLFFHQTGSNPSINSGRSGLPTFAKTSTFALLASADKSAGRQPAEKKFDRIAETCYTVFSFKNPKKKEALMKGMLVLVAAMVILVVVGESLWRKSGPVFNFPFPNAIQVEGRVVAPEQRFRFPRLFPGQLDSSLPVAPVLKVGDVVVIDMTSPTITFRQDNSFRVHSELSPEVSSSYIFNTDKFLPGTEKVRLEITYVAKELAIALHQTGARHEREWFWLRQVYGVKIQTAE